MAWRCRFKMTHWLISTQARRDPERAFASVFIVVGEKDTCGFELIRACLLGLDITERAPPKNCHRDHPAPDLEMRLREPKTAAKPPLRRTLPTRSCSGASERSLVETSIALFDPNEEELFGCLMVAPSLERSLVNYSTLEKSWRLTARRRAWVDPTSPIRVPRPTWLDLRWTNVRS